MNRTDNYGFISTIDNKFDITKNDQTRHTGDVFDLANAVMRKLAHVTEFSVLGAVLTIMLKGMMRISYGWVLFAGMSVALADETIQLFAGSRTSSVKDVWIDMSGFCTGVAVVILIMLIWRAVRRR